MFDAPVGGVNADHGRGLEEDEERRGEERRKGREFSQSEYFGTEMARSATFGGDCRPLLATDSQMIRRWKIGLRG